MEPLQPISKSSISTSSWVAITVIALGAFILIAFLKTCESSKVIGGKVEETAGHVENIVKKLPDIAAKFKTGTITTTFIESIPQVSATRGDILELATSQSNESFTRSDSKSTLWNTFYLGTTVSEIRVPTTFRYHLRLSDPWHLATRNTVCVVVAPSIRPSLPPAIHTNQIEKSTASGWGRFNKDENLATLERSITPTLEKRAIDPNHIRLVREACRQSVAEFVKKWLMREDYWRNDRFNSIIVVFPDEATFISDDQLEQFQYEPTIKL
jgi:hypothetical protein